MEEEDEATEDRFIPNWTIRSRQGQAIASSGAIAAVGIGCGEEEEAAVVDDADGFGGSCSAKLIFDFLLKFRQFVREVYRITRSIGELKRTQVRTWTDAIHFLPKFIDNKKNKRSSSPDFCRFRMAGEQRWPVTI